MWTFMHSSSHQLVFFQHCTSQLDHTILKILIFKLILIPCEYKDLMQKIYIYFTIQVILMNTKSIHLGCLLSFFHLMPLLKSLTQSNYSLIEKLLICHPFKRPRETSPINEFSIIVDNDLKTQLNKLFSKQACGRLMWSSGDDQVTSRVSRNTQGLSRDGLEWNKTERKHGAVKKKQQKSKSGP